MSYIEQVIQAAHPGRLYLSPGEALSLVPGVQPRQPESAAYQRILRGTYPWPTRLVAGRRVVAIADIIAAAGGADATAPAAAEPRRRGRPRKRAQEVDHV